MKFFKGVEIMSFRIAVASNDGITINEHFGKADKFLIFQFEGTMIELIEERIYLFMEQMDMQKKRFMKLLNLFLIVKLYLLIGLELDQLWLFKRKE